MTIELSGFLSGVSGGGVFGELLDGVFGDVGVEDGFDDGAVGVGELVEGLEASTKS